MVGAETGNNAEFAGAETPAAQSKL
jgi:hypothetical protein